MGLSKVHLRHRLGMKTSNLKSAFAQALGVNQLRCASPSPYKTRFGLLDLGSWDITRLPLPLSAVIRSQIHASSNTYFTCLFHGI